jgi:hypothetical protein
MVSFPLAFLPVTYTRSSSPFFTLHVPPSSFSLTWWFLLYLEKNYKSSSSSLCRFLHTPVTSSLYSQNIFFGTLFSNTLSLFSSLNIKDQVSHPYRTTDKIVVLCILIFNYFRQQKRTEKILDCEPLVLWHARSPAQLNRRGFWIVHWIYLPHNYTCSHLNESQQIFHSYPRALSTTKQTFCPVTKSSAQ